MLRRARDRDDILFTISTDSHHINEFANIRWGVHNARRGWVRSKYVVNTWAPDRFLEWLRR